MYRLPAFARPVLARLGGLALSASLVGALSACGPEFNEGDVQSDCGSDHARVGWSGALETHFHDVQGTVHVVDNCTLEIRDFHYDGGGLDVRVLGAEDSDWDNGQILTDNILGEVYEGETLSVPLPNELTLDDFDSISIWCVTASENFGDAELKP